MLYHDQRAWRRLSNDDESADGAEPYGIPRCDLSRSGSLSLCGRPSPQDATARPGDLTFCAERRGQDRLPITPALGRDGADRAPQGIYHRRDCLQRPWRRSDRRHGAQQKLFDRTMRRSAATLFRTGRSDKEEDEMAEITQDKFNGAVQGRHGRMPRGACRTTMLPPISARTARKVR